MTLLIPQGTSLGIGAPGGAVFADIINADRLTGYVAAARALQLGWNGVDPLTFTITLKAGIYLIAPTVAGFAFDTGIYPAGSAVVWNIEAGAFWLGLGGAGSDYNSFSPNGQAGGTALKARCPITINNLGTGAGGGGGGGRGGHANYSHGGPGGGGRPLGAGGAGVPPFNTGVYASGTYGASAATAGTKLLPGVKGLGGPGAGNGGDGGDLATAAANATAGELTAGGLPGAPGNCVEGNAFVAWTNPGTRIGAIV